MKTTPWLFVTGAPRSGTTFVGKVLSMPWSVDYIHEPFNPDCGIPGIKQRYLYADPDAPGQALGDKIEPLFRYKARLRTGMYPEDGPWKRAVKSVVGSRGPFYYRMARMNVFRRHVVLKDPVGCLLTEFLARRFGVNPVVMVRHPAAFVSSFKRLGWPVQLDALRAQKGLCARYFPDGEGLSETGDTVTDAARLWAALHVVLSAQLTRNPGWTVLRHEDLNAAPVEEFRRLYSRYGLPWSGGIERRVREMTGAGNRAEARGGQVQDFTRDSSALLELRLKGLTEEERQTVFDVTHSVSSRWYAASTFDLSAAKAPSGADAVRPNEADSCQEPALSTVGSR